MGMRLARRSTRYRSTHPASPRGHAPDEARRNSVPGRRVPGAHDVKQRGLPDNSGDAVACAHQPFRSVPIKPRPFGPPAPRGESQSNSVFGPSLLAGSKVVRKSPRVVATHGAYRQRSRCTAWPGQRNGPSVFKRRDAKAHSHPHDESGSIGTDTDQYCASRSLRCGHKGMCPSTSVVAEVPIADVVRHRPAHFRHHLRANRHNSRSIAPTRNCESLVRGPQ